MKSQWVFASLLLLSVAISATPAVFSQIVSPVPQTRVAAAIPEQKPARSLYTFILFYRNNDQATQAMNAAIGNGLKKRGVLASIKLVQIDDPAKAALVEEFGVRRAPMPLIVAVAPNGALTGMFPKRLADEDLDSAIVTPAMMETMKALQGQRLVFVCAHPDNAAGTPKSIIEFQTDPLFKDRMAVVSFSVADPAEQKFVAELALAPQEIQGTTLAVLAPPGVLVGKFAPTAPMQQIAAAIHQAGKCCDDPNCRHHQ